MSSHVVVLSNIGRILIKKWLKSEQPTSDQPKSKQPKSNHRELHGAIFCLSRVNFSKVVAPCPLLQPAQSAPVWCRETHNVWPLMQPVLQHGAFLCLDLGRTNDSDDRFCYLTRTELYCQHVANAANMVKHFATQKKMSNTDKKISNNFLLFQFQTEMDFLHLNLAAFLSIFFKTSQSPPHLLDSLPSQQPFL